MTVFDDDGSARDFLRDFVPRGKSKLVAVLGKGRRFLDHWIDGGPIMCTGAGCDSCGRDKPIMKVAVPVAVIGADSGLEFRLLELFEAPYQQLQRLDFVMDIAGKVVRMTVVDDGSKRSKTMIEIVRELTDAEVEAIAKIKVPDLEKIYPIPVASSAKRIGEAAPNETAAAPPVVDDTDAFADLEP